METKKPEKGQLFVKRDSILVENMPTYHERRIMAYGDEMMCVENTFRKGDVAPDHHHPHVQISYIVSGAFNFTIGGETCLLVPGDSAYIAGDMAHSVECVEAGALLDFFTPKRDEFVE